MNYLIALGAIILIIVGGIILISQDNVDPVNERVNVDVLNNTDDTDLANGLDRTESRPTTPANNGTTIDLSGQGLTQVPQSIFNQSSATVLDVSGNELSGALPAEVRHLSNLRTLDLSDNNFTGVPAEVGQLRDLEVLNLSNNPITGLPQEIGNLKNLQVLDLRGTDYSEADLSVIRQGLSANVEIMTDQ